MGAYDKDEVRKQLHMENISQAIYNLESIKLNYYKAFINNCKKGKHKTILSQFALLYQFNWKSYIYGNCKKHGIQNLNQIYSFFKNRLLS